MVRKFQENGMDELVASRLGQENNLPLTEDQLHKAVDTDLINGLANKAGIDATLFDTLLAKGLPKLVNALTPPGQSPEQVGQIDLDKAKELISQFLS